MGREISLRGPLSVMGISALILFSGLSEEAHARRSRQRGASAAAWHCLCYQERYQGRVVDATACRSTKPTCQKLQSRVYRGSKAIVAGSLSQGCTEVKGANPEAALGGRGKWLPSKRPGAIWSPAGCFLPQKTAAAVPAAPARPAQKTLPPCPEGIDDGDCREARLGDADNCDALIGASTATALIQRYGQPSKRSERVEWAATGEISEDWSWDGLIVAFEAPSMSAPVREINHCRIQAPFQGRTKRGIGLGATAEEVYRVYAGMLEPARFTPGLTRVKAGSVYYGITFLLTDGKVSGISIGSNGE